MWDFDVILLQDITRRHSFMILLFRLIVPLEYQQRYFGYLTKTNGATDIQLNIRTRGRFVEQTRTRANDWIRNKQTRTHDQTARIEVETRTAARCCCWRIDGPGWHTVAARDLSACVRSFASFDTRAPRCANVRHCRLRMLRRITPPCCGSEHYVGRMQVNTARSAACDWLADKNDGAVGAARCCRSAECEVWGMRATATCASPLQGLWIHANNRSGRVWLVSQRSTAVANGFCPCICMHIRYVCTNTRENRFSLMQSMWRWTRWNIKCFADGYHVNWVSCYH